MLILYQFEFTSSVYLLVHLPLLLRESAQIIAAQHGTTSSNIPTSYICMVPLCKHYLVHLGGSCTKANITEALRQFGPISVIHILLRVYSLQLTKTHKTIVIVIQDETIIDKKMYD